MTLDPMQIRQERLDWCIPAAVQFVGEKTGLFSGKSQQDLVDAGVELTFGSVPQALAALAKEAEAEHVDTATFEDWKARVQERLAAGDSVIVSIPNAKRPGEPQTWHMRVILACDEDGLRVFDPAKGEDSIPWTVVEDRRSKYPGGTDLLFIRRKP